MIYLKTFTVVMGIVILGIAYLLLYLPLYHLYKKLDTTLQKMVRTTLWILTIGGVLFFFIQIGLAVYIELQVNHQLGFRSATPDSEQGEPLIISRVDSNKTMFHAGLMENDTVRYSGKGNLYNLLIDNQEKDVKIPLHRHGKDFELPVRVPKMNIRYRKICILY